MLLDARILTPLSQRQSSTVVRLLLKYGFRAAIGLVDLGFAYAGLQSYDDANRNRGQQGQIKQQAGTCGSNIVGDKNQVVIDCVDKTTQIK